MAKTRKTRARKARPAAAAPPAKTVPSRPVRNSVIVGTEELGQRMRKVRMERRMTLKQVERAADLSATHLSEIERGRTSPTIGALVRIARALGRDTSYFIETEERSDVVLVGRDQAAKLTLGPGVEALVLTQGVPGSRLFAYRITLTPGSGKQGELKLAASDLVGSEAHYYLRRGEVSGRLGDDEVHLRAGDGLQASMTLSHVLRPSGSQPAELYALLTRPLDGEL